MKNQSFLWVLPWVSIRQVSRLGSDDNGNRFGDTGDYETVSLYGYRGEVGDLYDYDYWTVGIVSDTGILSQRLVSQLNAMFEVNGAGQVG